jgi:hypothetical protein
MLVQRLSARGHLTRATGSVVSVKEIMPRRRPGDRPTIAYTRWDGTTATFVADLASREVSRLAAATTSSSTATTTCGAC